MAPGVQTMAVHSQTSIEPKIDRSHEPIQTLVFLLRSVFSYMYYIIELRHTIAKSLNFGRNIPRTEIKSTATCDSISPLYIFPCKLELISRRANKAEIALSLSPDQIRSSKMAVHFFWIIWQGKLISETICCWTQCQVRPSKMDVHFFDQVAGDENTKSCL